MSNIMLVFLFIMAVQDYYKGEINDLLYIPFLFFVNFKIQYIVMFIIVVFLYKYIDSYVGGADIKLLFLFLLIYPLQSVMMWLLISLIIALFYAFFTKNRMIRMFPFFLISYIGILYGIK